jgi:uncharacterized protein YcfL
MKTFLITFTLAGTAALLIGGCTTPEHGAYLPENATKFNQETTAKFVLMDPGAQKSVTTSGLQEGRSADGKLQVAANVRNRENRRLQVQVNCDFKDAQGFVVESTPWQTLILTENGQETVRFAAANTDAKNYTIRIREAR